MRTAGKQKNVPKVLCDAFGTFFNSSQSYERIKLISINPSQQEFIYGHLLWRICECRIIQINPFLVQSDDNHGVARCFMPIRELPGCNKSDGRQAGFQIQPQVFDLASFHQYRNAKRHKKTQVAKRSADGLARAGASADDRNHLPPASNQAPLRRTPPNIQPAGVVAGARREAIALARFCISTICSGEGEMISPVSASTSTEPTVATSPSPGKCRQAGDCQKGRSPTTKVGSLAKIIMLTSVPKKPAARRRASVRDTVISPIKCTST